VCERKARARQKQIESKLTRDLFTFRLPFLAEKHQPYASIVCRYATKKHVRAHFSSGKFANVHFRTSARPFPSGGFPPKLQRSDAGHLGKVSPQRKILLAQ